MTKESKEVLVTIGATFLVCWIMANACSFIGGLVVEYERGCDDKMRRIEYIFPGYELGCWLGGYSEDV